jgi:uncharacterized protein YjiS (DUF1127 family)
MAREHTATYSGAGHKLLALTRRTWTYYWTRRAAHDTVAVLNALDDRTLKDLGLHRSEIQSVVFAERGCDRTRVAEHRICLARAGSGARVD